MSLLLLFNGPLDIPAAPPAPVVTYGQVATSIQPATDAARGIIDPSGGGTGTSGGPGIVTGIE